MSDEAKKRSKFYREEFVRKKSASQFGSDYLGFLASCGIKLNVDLYADDDLARVSELVERTNQLNFSGRKYLRSEILPDTGRQRSQQIRPALCRQLRFLRRRGILYRPFRQGRDTR